MNTDAKIGAVPYFSQFESRDLVQDFIENPQAVARDPLWQRSGAETAADYGKWAGHLCGMACLKMYLAAVRRIDIPIMELARKCFAYGGYKQTADGTIRGLFYKEFIDFVANDFQIDGTVAAPITGTEIIDLLTQGNLFIASVHPSIRTPQNDPPKLGGHLVLVFQSAGTAELIFHNPSGFQIKTQENVQMELSVFEKFFAGRGVILKR